MLLLYISGVFDSDDLCIVRSDCFLLVCIQMSSHTVGQIMTRRESPCVVKSSTSVETGILDGGWIQMLRLGKVSILTNYVVSLWFLQRCRCLWKIEFMISWWSLTTEIGTFFIKISHKFLLFSCSSSIKTARIEKLNYSQPADTLQVLVLFTIFLHWTKHFLFHILKGRAQCKLKTVADEHYRDGALEVFYIVPIRFDVSGYKDCQQIDGEKLDHI